MASVLDVFSVSLCVCGHGQVVRTLSWAVSIFLLKILPSSKRASVFVDNCSSAPYI